MGVCNSKQTQSVNNYDFSGEQASTLRTGGIKDADDLLGEFWDDGNTLHSLFTNASKLHPKEIAVEYGDVQLSYSDLDSTSNQLSRYLRKALGENQRLNNSLVAVFLHRSIPLIQSQLAILKAGAAFVSLHRQAAERSVHHILKDTGAKVILTDESGAKQLEGYGVSQDLLIVTSGDWQSESASPLSVSVSPQDLAYVIYTSGSTGTPKGVEIQHSSIVNFVHVHTTELVRYTTSDRVLQGFSTAFDGSLWEIWPALCSVGATLVLVDTKVIQSGPRLAAVLTGLRITIIYIVPTILRMMGPDARLPTVRFLAVGGEAVTSDIVEQWAPGRKFANAYGPTECTILSTFGRLDADDKIHIGKALPTYSCHVLDPDTLEALDIGEEGELCIGGPGLARGYRNLPEMTASKFINHPKFGRIYRSGDLVKWTPEKNIDFLGRIDRQVKIRGYRIEMSGVETAIRSLDVVKEAVVLAENGELVAYVVLESQDVQSSGLRRSLKGLVPAYAMPSKFNYLKEIPLLASGKADRKNIAKAYQESESDVMRDMNCMFEVISHFAKATPKAVAIDCGGKRVSYKELDDRSNQVAHFLRSMHGIRNHQDQVVGLCMERTEAVYIALIGIHKAGAAYTYININFPGSRLDSILENADPQMIFCDQAGLNFLGNSGQKLVHFEEELFIPFAVSPVRTVPNPEDLHVILYTSGTTGKPKGVELTHGNALNFFNHTTELFHTTSEHRILQFSTLEWDGSVMDTWLAFTAGGTLIAVPNAFILTGEELERLQITGLLATPTVMRAIENPQSPYLKYVCIGGEKLTPDLVEKWATKRTRVINVYGPTELTIFITTAELTDPNDITVGTSYANAALTIVDENMQPVSRGAVGELVCSGPMVARGYRRSEDKTKSKFVDHPKLGRIYRTGDLAIQDSKGRFDIKGRIDFQVKIRGFRVEMLKIEVVLRTLDWVQEACVVAVNDDEGRTTLLAYIQAHEFELRLNEKEIRVQLEEYLVGPEIPSQFQILDEIPRLANGKVDRKKLKDMGEDEMESFSENKGNDLPSGFKISVNSPSVQSPRFPDEFLSANGGGALQETTSLSNELIQCAATVLKLEEDSINLKDSFKDLGGHSITAIRFSQLLSSKFKVGITVADIYTVVNLNELLDLIYDKQERKSRKGSMDSIEYSVTWEEEIELPKSIGRKAKRIPNDILLTGCTGFMGSFVLKELLCDTDSNVYCAVRAKDIKQAKARIKTTLQKYKIWKNSYAARIMPLVTDLAESMLGMDEDEWYALSDNISQIIHVAAQTSSGIPYEEIKKTNVTGVKTLLELASIGQKKSFHFVSTLGVFYNPNHLSMPRVYENDSFEDFPELELGYTQSKWVAERLVEQARSRGITSTIIRMGHVTGDSATGICIVDDSFHRMIQACIKLKATPFKGMLPHMNPQFTRFNMVPVDYCAKAVVRISLFHSCLNKNFHIAPPAVPTTKAFDLIRAEGFPLKRISVEDWTKECLEVENPMQAIVVALGPENWIESWITPDFDDANFNTFCKDIPKPDLSKCIMADVKHMMAQGVISLPKLEVKENIKNKQGA